MKRDFLELANRFVPKKFMIGGWYWSEKLDGIRCYWDGGITTGMRCAEVPWANIEKHHRFVNEQFSTGLWSRYAQPIRAPKWWTDTLPLMPLDGELHMGRGSWQALSSTVKSHVPDSRWNQVKYAVFNSPYYGTVFADSVINSPHYKKTFSKIPAWILDCINPDIERRGVGLDKPFYAVRQELKAVNFGPHSYWHPHYELPLGFTAAEAEATQQATRIVEAGGEGLILRDHSSYWKPVRHSGLLKVKPYEDTEGTVIGYTFAEGTDLDKSLTGIETNKLLGLMGSMRLKLDSGVEFDLSGFTNLERELVTDAGPSDSVRAYGVSHPGEKVPDWITHPVHKRGSRVTFKYRELSSDGAPKEARYLRGHDE